VPLLVIQGTDDTINPEACSVDLYNEAPPPKYYLSLLAAGHLSPYTDPGADQVVVDHAVTDFLNGYLKGESAALGDIVTDGSVPQVATVTTAVAVDSAAQPCM
jgi:hypothetical protein